MNAIHFNVVLWWSCVIKDVSKYVTTVFSHLGVQRAVGNDSTTVPQIQYLGMVSLGRWPSKRWSWNSPCPSNVFLPFMGCAGQGRQAFVVCWPGPGLQ